MNGYIKSIPLQPSPIQTNWLQRTDNKLTMLTFIHFNLAPPNKNPFVNPTTQIFYFKNCCFHPMQFFFSVKFYIVLLKRHFYAFSVHKTCLVLIFRQAKIAGRNHCVDHEIRLGQDWILSYHVVLSFVQTLSSTGRAWIAYIV